MKFTQFMNPQQPHYYYPQYNQQQPPPHKPAQRTPYALIMVAVAALALGVLGVTRVDTIPAVMAGVASLVVGGNALIACLVLGNLHDKMHMR